MEITNDLKDFVEQVKFDFERGLISEELYKYNMKTLGVKL